MSYIVNKLLAMFQLEALIQLAISNYSWWIFHMMNHW